MQPPKIGFSLQNNYPIPINDVIAMLRRAGFQAVSPAWNPDTDLAAIVNAARNLQMEVQSLHGPFRKACWLWDRDSEAADKLKADILTSIDNCVRFQIPILVLHVWMGFTYTFRPDALYFDRYDEIVDYAELKNVKLAFENTEGDEYLHALMTRYKGRPHVGYCWDSGHELCYTDDRNFLASYGDRLIMTHLNDNLGLRSPEGTLSAADDLHYLPYDGAADWDKYVRRLQNARPLDTLNFELKIVSLSDSPEDLIYSAMTLEEYITEAGKRARRIAEKVGSSL